MPSARWCWVPVAALLLVCCADEDPRFSTPATTFRTYRTALTRGDAETSWMCLSRAFRRLEYNDDQGRWTALLGTDGRGLGDDVWRLEIVEEALINDRVAFLQFEPTTVEAGRAPFFYFLHEQDGWKITTHLDSLFRDELEGAIGRGEFRLPGPQR